MKTNQHRIWLAIAVLLVLTGCGDTDPKQDNSAQSGHETSATPAKGAHNGRLLSNGEFALELAIFETGVPPEFRVWATDAGAPVAPQEVDLQVTLTRLGDVQDVIGFAPQDDFLRGDTVIYEPHSFVVTIEARYAGETHRWEYDNFEGRTRIGPDIARAFELETELAGPATIIETLSAYGRIVADPERSATVSARYEGVIESVAVSAGDVVERGQRLANIESNESLKSYSITAPIRGVVVERLANPGEQTDERQLFRILDTSFVRAELAIFVSDRGRVMPGARVIIDAGGGVTREGVVSRLNPVTEINQSVLAHVVLENSDGVLVPGSYITGEIQVAEHRVPLAVKRSGLQAFRDFTVVYAQIGDEYEVRMLDLGRQDAESIEVLGGLDAGTRYVTGNSYLVKADIEKSGASHDH